MPKCGSISVPIEWDKENVNAGDIALDYGGNGRRRNKRRRIAQTKRKARKGK
jgi:hypothetical protein